MKHQGQTMSETISMVSLGVTFMRWSFLLVMTGLANLPGLPRRYPWFSCEGTTGIVGG